MKQLNITFDDQEHKALETKKELSGLNWHDFIIKAVDKYEHQKDR